MKAACLITVGAALAAVAVCTAGSARADEPVPGVTVPTITDVVNFLGGPVGATVDLGLLAGGLTGNEADSALLAGIVGADLARVAVADASGTLAADLGPVLP
jgi:hypothetical protein